VRRIVGLRDESVDDCAMWIKERRDDDVADGRVGPAPEIGAPLAPFRFVDRVKPLLDLVTCKSSLILEIL
jgi:hypothetical protein